MAGRFSVETVFKGVDRVSAPVTRMQNRVGKFTRAAERGFKNATRSLNRFTSGLVRGGKRVVAFGAGAVAALTGAVVGLIQQYSKIEDAEAAFTPLLGSAEKATRLVKELNVAAASTPFQFETLAGTANQLLPIMNGDIEETIRVTKMLGDTAGGNAQKLESITRGFAKAALKTKVDMESLNMIVEAGVPIFDDLAKVVGVEMGPAFFKMVSAGKISSRQLSQAFENMTQKGGIFFNGMEIASKTTSGIFSTLKDNISLTAAEVGGILAPTIKDLMQAAIGYTKVAREWISQNRELIASRFKDFLQTIKDTFVFLREHGGTILKVVAAFTALVVVMNTLAAVLTLINLIAMANPITLIALGVVAAIAAFAGLLTYLVSISDKFNFIADAMETVASAGRRIGGVFGFGDDADSITGGAQIQSPQERTARSIEEHRNTEKSEVTIKDETKRARVTGGRMGPGVKLQTSGGF